MPSQLSFEEHISQQVREGKISLERGRDMMSAYQSDVDGRYNDEIKRREAAVKAQAEIDRQNLKDLYARSRYRTPEQIVRDQNYSDAIKAREAVVKAQAERDKEDLKALYKAKPQWSPKEYGPAPDPATWKDRARDRQGTIPTGMGNSRPASDTISGKSPSSIVPSGSGGGSTVNGGSSPQKSPTGSANRQQQQRSPSAVKEIDRPVTQMPWGNNEPGGKIVKSGGLPGINQSVNPRGNGSPARPTPNSSNYVPSQPIPSNGRNFGIGAGSGIAGELARADAERARSNRERKAIADTQTPEQRDSRANDHLEKYGNSFGGPRDYIYPPGYNNAFGNPDFDRLVQDANRHRERNGLGPIGGNGAAGIGRGGLGGGAAGVGGAAGQLGGSANPNWFSPSDPNQPWNAPYDPYKAIDPATGLPWLDRDKMPQMPSYPRPLAPIYQNPDGTPMPMTPDGRPIGPDGVPLWPPNDPNVPPIPGWNPPGPPDPNAPVATDLGLWVFTAVYGGPGAGVGIFASHPWSQPGAQNNPPSFGIHSGGTQYGLFQAGKLVYGSFVGVSNPPSMSGLRWVAPKTPDPKRDPAPQPFVPVGRPAPVPRPGGDPLGSPVPNGSPLGGLVPGLGPDGSAAPALAPNGNPAPAPDRAPGFAPTRPMSPITPPVPRPSPSPTPNPQRNPQRDPGPQPLGGALPDPSPSPSGNPMGGFGSGKSEFKGGSDPSGSPAPSPNPAPGSGSGTGTGTGNPPDPNPKCKYPDISSVSVDIFDGFDDKTGEPKKKAQIIKCLPDAVDRVKLAFARIYEIESKKPDEAVALPEAWAVRKGTDRPQLVIVYAEIFGSGKLGSSRWSLTVPHYRGTAKSNISAPSYKRGNWQGQLTLNDGSTIIVNANSSSECARAINKLKILVPFDYRTRDGKAIKPRIVDNPNLDLKSCNVVPVMAKYYATGQKDMTPTWSQSLRKG